MRILSTYVRTSVDSKIEIVETHSKLLLSTDFRSAKIYVDFTFNGLPAKRNGTVYSLVIFNFYLKRTKKKSDLNAKSFFSILCNPRCLPFLLTNCVSEIVFP